jgi:hypothetical protein
MKIYQSMQEFPGSASSHSALVDHAAQCGRGRLFRESTCLMPLAAADQAAANEQLKSVVRKYEKTAPKLAAWLEENVSESLTAGREGSADDPASQA